MTTATLPAPLFAPAGAHAATGGDVTLDDRVMAILEDLALREHARCLVCGGDMVATGQCRNCGSSLA
jgi:tRNA(Ile2) C34 agmatinyltransferase TiaS